MKPLRHAVRALALSLTLSAVGAFCVIGATSPAQASAGDPIGGPKLGAGGVIVNLEPGVPPPPTMPGASFLLADMNTGQILVAKAPHAPHLPASTLKTLTALTLIPLLDANAKIMVKPQDVRAEGSRLGILPGTAYSVGTLLQGLLLASGNDAAYALARGNKGVAVTLKAMNATAADLSAFDTVAKDPSGLDKAGQSSSAYDLALIGRAAMKLPDFRRYVIARQTLVPGGSVNGKPRPAFRISSHNTLLYNYPGAIGIKTGYTNAAMHTYIGAATRSGKTYLVTQMASPNGSWRPHAALLDWAFTHGSSVTPIGRLVERGITTTPKPTAGVPTPSEGVPTPSAGVPTPSAGVPTQSAGDPLRSAPNPSPRESALTPAFPPWVALAALIVGLTLAGVSRRRFISRRSSLRVRDSRDRS